MNEKEKKTEEKIYKLEVRPSISCSWGCDFKTGKPGLMSISLHVPIETEDDVDAEFQALAIRAESLWKEFDEKDMTAITNTFKPEEHKTIPKEVVTTVDKETVVDDTDLEEDEEYDIDSIDDTPPVVAEVMKDDEIPFDDVTDTVADKFEVDIDDLIPEVEITQKDVDEEEKETKQLKNPLTMTHEEILSELKGMGIEESNGVKLVDMEPIEVIDVLINNMEV